jgi:hypothetical protein
MAELTWYPLHEKVISQIISRLSHEIKFIKTSFNRGSKVNKEEAAVVNRPSALAMIPCRIFPVDFHPIERYIYFKAVQTQGTHSGKRKKFPAALSFMPDRNRGVT